MGKMRLGFIVLLVLTLLVGCNEPTVTETNPTQSNQNSTQITDTVIISQWNLFVGEMKHSNAELPSIAKNMTEDGSLEIFDAQYIVFELPEDKLENSTTSGWRINLDELVPQGVLISGEIVLSPDQNRPPVVCIYDGNTGMIQCLFRKDLTDNGMDLFKLSDFDVIVTNKSSQAIHSYPIEEIWEIHTGLQNFEEAYPILDGDWEYYCVKLVHSQYPALQYELNFGVCDNYLYIENLNTQNEVRVPVDQINQ